ncbi:MAG TPA: GNAT family protein [Pyrinomonadaceae bacterium]|nr:GNAT family protein [Pyrinomonadaceae bacterium]
MTNENDFAGLETARLTLRQFACDDLASFHAYRNDPDIARYQSWSDFSEQEARDFIAAQKALRPGVPGNWFQFAVELKMTGALIGDCALKIDGQEPRQAEIGFTLAREHQGRGYASEAVSRVLDYAFRDLCVHRVVAITDCENAPSVALLERIGMRREGHFKQNVWFKGKWGDEYLYAILRDEWTGSAPAHSRV